MSALSHNRIEPSDAGPEIDLRWGFEPEAWMSLRSRKAMIRRPAPADMPAQTRVPNHHPRVLAVLRAFFG